MRSTPSPHSRIDFTDVSNAELKRGIFAGEHLLLRTMRAEDPLRALEEELVEALSVEFEGRFPEALKKAKEIIESGALDDLLTEGDTSKLLAAIEPFFVDGWTEAIQAPVRVGIEAAYANGRVATLQPLKIEPVYNLVDEHARAMLTDDTMYWVGNAYGNEIGPAIARVIQREVVEQGLSRRMAAAKLEELFHGRFPERSRAYWNVVSAAGVVRARTFGNIESFVQAEVITYRFVAVMDGRTSLVCQEMNGRIFTVEAAVAQRDRFLAAESPEDAKEAHPWPRESEVKGKETDALSAAGILMPPLHGNCRSQVLPESFAD